MDDKWFLFGGFLSALFTLMLRATLQVIGASSDISLAFIVMVQVVLGAVVGILASWKGLIWYVLAFVLTGFGILIMLLNVMAIQW